MKYNKIYGLIVAISVLIFSGCTDTKENAVQDSGIYSFFDPTTPVKITKPVEVNGTVEGNSKEISVVLLKHGLAAVGETVEMIPFSSRYGSIVNLIVDTDANGKAIFEYKAPEGSDYNDIRGHDVTIKVIFENPPPENPPVYVNGGTVVEDEDASPVILLTQEFLLQFR